MSTILNLQFSIFKYLSNRARSQKPEARGQNGFTLIELLTVIAVIAVLTGILSFSYYGVRQRARDAQRKGDAKQIQSALELYRADNNAYPTTATLSTCGGPFTGTGGSIYMQKIPCDPKTNTPYFYSSPTTSTYTIATCLENANDKDKAPSNPGISCTPAYYYVTTNP